MIAESLCTHALSGIRYRGLPPHAVVTAPTLPLCDLLPRPSGPTDPAPSARTCTFLFRSCSSMMSLRSASQAPQVSRVGMSGVLVMCRSAKAVSTDF